ncbi:hypothetical protein JDBV02_00775 [Mycobacterium phage terelak]|nr:hypothetical protein JDBV02_00775 [Mycobacterium phage terelak]
MIVNGIEWTHPRFSTAYYGFNPVELRAEAEGIELVAWLRSTPRHETYWTVRGTRGDDRLFEVNFDMRETALVGASILVEKFFDEPLDT